MPTSGRRRGIGSVRYGCVIAVGAPGQAPSRAARGHPARGGRIEGVAVTQGGSLERPGRVAGKKSPRRTGGATPVGKLGSLPPSQGSTSSRLARRSASTRQVTCGSLRWPA